MQFVTLKNEKMEVILCDRGASIFRIIFDNHEMVLTPKHPNDFLKKDLFYGKTIGMVCGRIVIDNQIVLHGGDNGLSNQDFEYVVKDNSATFSYKKVKVIYTLLDNELRVEFIVEADEPQLVALTNHSYFCLGEDDINNLQLEINSDKYIVVDKNLVPIGTSQIDKQYDFHEFACPIKDGNIDNYFFTNDGKALLKGRRYGLEIDYDFQGIQVFTDHFVDETETLLTDKTTYRSIALEPEDNQLDRKELLPGQVYKRYIKYRFTKL